MIELRCGSCGWNEVCGEDGVARWLRVAEKLRHDRQPDMQIMLEILRATASQLGCPECQQQGLLVVDAEPTDAWPSARLCEACGKPIPAERLDALPHTTMCTACQQTDERGEGSQEIEYCPRCGAPMELKLSKGAGISRYVMVCSASPPCSRRRK
ncbi:MAG: TraR/DksA C4-type zinc finger protein [Planctomycetota bacterium]|nr:TraR/DksA C4-type zinc finger protein [Planctomycetota bacterium]